MAHPTGVPSAEDVGDAFVSQYYTMLNQSPQEMHRFYTNTSRFTYAEGGGAGRTYIAQNAIHDKFMCLDYGDFKIELKSVDSQESVDDAVLVLVTGVLISNSCARLKFVQSFVLARQEIGYYVRNDIFRFLEDESVVDPASVVLNDVPELPSPIVMAPEPVLEHSCPTADELLESHLGEQSNSLEEQCIVEELCSLPERVGISNTQEYAEQEKKAVHQDTLPLLSGLPVASIVETSAPQIEETVAEAPKQSYASILKVMKASSGPTVSTQRTVKAAPVSGERAVRLATPAQSHPALPVQERGANGSVANLEGEGRTIYIKSLPVSVTASQLADAFSKFGLIKPGGINVRSMKGFCFAFLEFKDSSSAQSAIKASPVLIGGRLAYIEEKRQQVSQAVRGRGSSGRGDFSYLNNGIGSRGRGMNAGRGLGRNAATGQDRDRDVSRGRGTGHMRS